VIIVRAWVAVVTQGSVVHKHAPLDGIAAFIGAWIVVIADHQGPAAAHPGHARVPVGAGVQVITGQKVRALDATGDPVAAVVGAGIQVVAVEQALTHAHPTEAMVPQRADAAVVAGVGIKADHAP
jgi:hypothetical protein